MGRHDAARPTVAIDPIREYSFVLTSILYSDFSLSGAAGDVQAKTVPAAKAPILARIEQGKIFIIS